MKTKTRPTGTKPAAWQSAIRGRINPGTERDEQGFRKLNPTEEYLKNTFLNILQNSGTAAASDFAESISLKERLILQNRTRLTRVIRSSVTRNPKTLYSFDPSPCPRKTAGNPCPYCYTITSSFKMPTIILPYETTREIQRLSWRMIEKLNSTGGIRIFSRGDYDGKPETDRQIETFLQDCQERGLQAKAITKNLSFVDRHHDNPGLTMINLSLDRFETVPFSTAREYRKKYNKVILRFVILNDSDLEIARRIGNCLLTFGHGNSSYTRKGFHTYTKEEKIRLTQPEESTCCVTGTEKKRNFFNQMITCMTCENCRFKCGIGGKENSHE